MKTKTPYVKLLHLLLISFFLFIANAVFAQRQNIILEATFEGSNPFGSPLSLAGHQYCCSYSLTQSTDHARAGTYSAKFDLRKSDPVVSSSYRSEVEVGGNVGDSPTEGERWYGGSWFLPSPWTQDGFGESLLQWHDNDNTSPPFSILVFDGHLWGRVNINNNATNYDLGLVTTYQGNWMDMVLHIKWTNSNSGLIECWLNGVKKMGSGTSNNTVNLRTSSSQGQYMKIGMNKFIWFDNPSLSHVTERIFYVDEFRVGNASATYADVAPSTTATPPSNQLPSANAGSDVVLTLPRDSTSLIGTGTDADGTIAGYSWSKQSGPSTYTLSSASSSTAKLTNLGVGVYVFKLTVTDNNGATGIDSVKVTVNAAPNQAPTANAGSDITLTLPTNSTPLTGSGSDADGTIVSYAWSWKRGPSTYTMTGANTATPNLSNLGVGVYVFNLTVTDNNGATGIDSVKVTVNAAPNQAPTANAGSDITLTLPTNSTSLIGTGTDADGTIASYAWSKQSGPSTFTLSSANASTAQLSNLGVGVYVFKLTVTDNNGATGIDSVKVTVNAAPNQAPTANAGNNITLTLPTNSTPLPGSGSDADGTIVSYQWSNYSSTGSYTLSSATSSTGQLSNLTAGVYVFKLTVTDNGGLTGSDTVTVRVNAAPNQPPTANAGNNITLTLPTNSTPLTGSGSDPDGTIVSYTWSWVSGTPYTLTSATSQTANVSNLAAGTYKFMLTVKDNNGAMATDEVTITVNAVTPANQSPVAVAGNNVTLNLPANSTSLNGTGSHDPDGTIVSYSWSLVSSTGSYTITGAGTSIANLSNLTAGTYVFKLTVTDNGGATDEDNVTVVVSAIANQPPVANAGSNITITLPTNSTQLNGANSTDADGTITTYEWSWVNGNGTYTIANTGIAATMLNNLQAGTYTFRLKVTDNDGATSTDDVTVTVNAAPNQSPTANAGSDITLTLPVNSTILQGSGYDPDGTIASYAWSRVSGPTTYTIASTGNASTGLNGLVQGVYVFKLKVTDNNGATASDSVKVTVNAAAPPANQAPTANAGSDVTLTLPVNSTILTGSGYDADGTIASYAWTRVSGPTTYTIANAGLSATGLSNLVQGTYVFQLKVTDNAGATAMDVVTVIVKPANNQAPSANAGADITLTLPTNSTTLYGSGSDADGTISSYAWTKISGPSTYAIANTTAMTTGLSNLVQGTYVFQLKVTDNNGATGIDSVKVTVNAAGTIVTANQPPVARTESDIVLVLPVNTTQLHGNTSSDPDGTITAYEWTQVSGPNQGVLINGGTSVATVSELTTGIYVFQLKVTDNKGASSSKTMRVTVENQHGTGVIFIVYPNPTHANLTLQYTENANGKYQLMIYDANRRLMYNQTVDKTQNTITQTIDVSGYGSGEYFIEMLSSDNVRTTKQFIKM